MRKKIVTAFSLLIALFVTAGIFALPASSAEKTYRLRYQVPVPAGYLKVYEEMAAKVSKASNGQLKIKIFSAGQLVPFPEVIKAVKSRTLDMASLVTGFHDELQLADLLNGIPMGWSNLDEAMMITYKVQNGRINELIKEDLANQGVAYIGNQWVGSVALLSKKPVQTIDDFKGLKVDCIGKITQTWIKNMGGEPYTIPVEEAYTSMATGIVDAEFSGSAGYYEAIGFRETAQYYHKPYPINAMIVPIAINQEIWESMPNNLKEILRSALVELAMETQLNEVYSDLTARTNFKMVSWDQETVDSMRKAAIEAMDTVKDKGPLAAEFIKIYKESMEALK